MSDSLNCANQQIPCYSGITINITNPSTAFPTSPSIQQKGGRVHTVTNPSIESQAYINKGEYLEPVKTNYSESNNVVKNKYNTGISEKENLPQAYPQQYYMNNYDYSRGINNGVNNEVTAGYTQKAEENGFVRQQEAQHNSSTNNSAEDINAAKSDNEVNTETSKEIINELNEKNAEQKELEKNGKKTKVVSLTNEYIMSLENYLNNPNTDIRLMASKEILTRLDEDKSRYDDAALNALLNKMLQDPNKLIRIAAMSAFSSELASGNDYTVQLLNQIQQNPDSDPEDVLEASQILLKRSASTEIKYTPVIKQEQKVEEQ